MINSLKKKQYMKLYYVIFIYYHSLDNNIVTVAELNLIKKSLCQSYVND